MIEVALIFGQDGGKLDVAQPYKSFERLPADERMLVTSDPYRVHGQFQTATVTTQTTTTLITPEGNGSILITDIVIGSKKAANSVLILQFDDGTNQAVLISPDTINQPVNFSWSPAGRIQGWRSARLDIVTSGGNPDATITVGYVKLTEGLIFAEWDALR